MPCKIKQNVVNFFVLDSNVFWLGPPATKVLWSHSSIVLGSRFSAQKKERGYQLCGLYQIKASIPHTCCMVFTSPKTRKAGHRYGILMYRAVRAVRAVRVRFEGGDSAARGAAASVQAWMRTRCGSVVVRNKRNGSAARGWWWTARCVGQEHGQHGAKCGFEMCFWSEHLGCWGQSTPLI